VKKYRELFFVGCWPTESMGVFGKFSQKHFPRTQFSKTNLFFFLYEISKRV